MVQIAYFQLKDSKNQNSSSSSSRENWPFELPSLSFAQFPTTCFGNFHSSCSYGFLRGIRTSITGLKHLSLAHENGEPTWALPNLPRTRPIPQPPLVRLVGFLPRSGNPALSENRSSCPAIAYALKLHFSFNYRKKASFHWSCFKRSRSLLKAIFGVVFVPANQAVPFTFPMQSIKQVS